MLGRSVGELLGRRVDQEHQHRGQHQVDAAVALRRDQPEAGRVEVEEGEPGRREVERKGVGAGERTARTFDPEQPGQVEHWLAIRKGRKAPAEGGRGRLFRLRSQPSRPQALFAIVGLGAGMHRRAELLEVLDVRLHLRPGLVALRQRVLLLVRGRHHPLDDVLGHPLMRDPVDRRERHVGGRDALVGRLGHRAGVVERIGRRRSSRAAPRCSREP